MTLAARLYDAVHRLLAMGAWLAVAFITVGVSIDIVLRNLRWGSIPWILEASEYAMFVLAFLGAPWVLRLGGHVRVDIVLTGLPPRARARCEAIGDAIGLAVSLVILYYAAAVALASRAQGARVIKEFIFPEWWIFAFVAWTALLLVIEFARRLASAGRERRAETGPDLDHRGV
ncbi:MAG: TRAP transporter small permease [Alphaproteobacteria bacterium]|nr:TRAP transporter small permease [Alphaproteobacteria bacterium]